MSKHVKRLVIGIDPGSSVSGVAWMVEGQVPHGAEVGNGEVYGFVERLIAEYAGMGEGGGNGRQMSVDSVVIVIEDIRPYKGMRLYRGLIECCKVIGELYFRFGAAGWCGSVELVARNSVKIWAFERFPEVCRVRVSEKIARENKRRAAKGLKLLTGRQGGDRAATFHWVDDRIITACMKVMYGIATPLPGKSNGLGLVGHSWQALSVASYFRAGFCKGR